MGAIDDEHGILFPRHLPTFHRVPAPPALSATVRWFWIPRWSLAPGETSRQEILPYPASNLVVQQGGTALSGPTTRASHRDLRGRGWAVGMLLRPAGVAALHADPRVIRDDEVPFDAPDLHHSVAAAMALAAPDAARHEAVAACSTWLSARVPHLDPRGELANAMEDEIATDPDIVRVDDVARRLHVSPRTVQRLARRYIGLPPLAVIRRYRLQESAQLLREDPSVTVSQVAARLGYADHAHLTSDFRRVLGMTPNAYRRFLAQGAEAHQGSRS